MRTRVLVLGLDAATFDLIEPWVQEGRLSHFQRLMETGAWGRLDSTIPPITAVAWNTFATGKNPGKHGVFDFVRREDDGYRIRIVNGGNRKTTPFWRILDCSGLRVGVMNMPMTYPPDRLEHGFVISGFDAPGFESDFVHPSHLKGVLQRTGYVIAPLERTREAWARSVFDSLQVQKRAFLELKRIQRWDVLVMVFMQLDAAQHLFWYEMEMQDPQFGNVIPRLYKVADTLLGELLDELDDQTTLIVVSDHGAGPLRKAVSINKWLLQEGYLVLKKNKISSRFWQRLLINFSTFLKGNLSPSVKTRLKMSLPLQDMAESYLLSSQIEWKKTRAFSLGEYGGIFVNLEGREATGIVPRKNYENLRNEISGRLSSICDPATGKSIFRQIYRREEVYNGPYVAQAPDLVPDWDYSYECRSRVENVGSHIEIFSEKGEYIPFTDTTKTGTHRPKGILLMHGPPVDPGIVRGARLMDLTPTLLHLVGVPVPDGMDGRVLTEALKPEWLAQHPVTYQAPDTDAGTMPSSTYAKVEEAKVEERLRALGYLD